MARRTHIHQGFYYVSVLLIWLVKGCTTPLAEEFSDAHTTRNEIAACLLFLALVVAAIYINNPGKW
jgi:hypothetical protein